MPVSFYLIETAPEVDNLVRDELNKLNGTAEVHRLFGEYDLIAKADLPDFEAFNNYKGMVSRIKGVIRVKPLASAHLAKT